MPSTLIPLDEIIITSTLADRPARSTNVERETRCFIQLARRIAESPNNPLQVLADAALELCHADSAGVSVLEHDEFGQKFRWHALAGKMESYLGSTMPRTASPCGTVLDTNELQLMREPVRCYPAIAELEYPIYEVLLAPFHRDGRAVGTIWVVTHSPDKQIDSDDARLVTSLAQFVSSATELLIDIRGLGTE